MGEVVANVFLKVLNEGKLSKSQLSKFHLFGGSMGAQLFGVTGRTLIRLSDNAYKFDRSVLLQCSTKIVTQILGNTFVGRRRITGLDPCNLDFPPKYSQHLSEKDAKFVDIIHTAMGVRGSTATGTADFYPNGGAATQPGCDFVALNENGMPSMLSV